MSRPAIYLENVGVSFRPFVDSKPTLRRGLRRAHSEVVALKDVSFRVEQGEAFGIVGHNGAGKTTLLKVMAQTLAPTTGKVVVNGKISTLLSLGVGFKTQLSGRRNVYLGGLAVGLSKAQIDERFDDIVDYAELWDAIDRPVGHYSSGMFARLAFAISMFLDPEIVLLDEVLSVGDASFREKSMNSMREMLERSGTIVFVSHSLESVSSFCDRAAWLDHGSVKTVGPAEDVVAEYRAAVAARKGGR